MKTYAVQYQCTDESGTVSKGRTMCVSAEKIDEAREKARKWAEETEAAAKQRGYKRTYRILTVTHDPRYFYLAYYDEHKQFTAIQGAATSVAMLKQFCRNHGYRFIEAHELAASEL